MSVKQFVALLPLLAVFANADPATFTHYGSGDSTGSQNCANPPASAALACGAGSNNVQGYTAAISQNDYGAGPGAGAGPGCGKCWTLTINADENGNPVTQKTINVTVNNLCPAQGNEEWCDIPAGGTNQHGGQVHFDICSDNGGSEAFFTSVGAGKGTATEISCGGGNAAESSSAVQSSTYQPTSPASSAPASSPYTSSAESAPSSAASSPYTSSAESAPSSAAGSSQGTPPSSTAPSSTGGSPYQGGGGAGNGGTSIPQSSSPPYHQGGKAGVHPSFSFPIPQYTSHHHSPHPTPTPGHGYHHPHPGYPGGPWSPGNHPGGYGGSKPASAAAAQSSDECLEEEEWQKAHPSGY